MSDGRVLRVVDDGPLLACVAHLGAQRAEGRDAAAEGVVAECDRLAALLPATDYAQLALSLAGRMRALLFSDETTKETRLAVLNGVIARLCDAWCSGRRSPGETAVRELRAVLREVLASRLDSLTMQPSVLSSAARILARTARAQGDLVGEIRCACSEMAALRMPPTGALFLFRHAFASAAGAPGTLSGAASDTSSPMIPALEHESVLERENAIENDPTLQNDGTAAEDGSGVGTASGTAQAYGTEPGTFVVDPRDTDAQKDDPKPRRLRRRTDSLGLDEHALAEALSAVGINIDGLSSIVDTALACCWDAFLRISPRGSSPPLEPHREGSGSPLATPPGSPRAVAEAIVPTPGFEQGLANDQLANFHGGIESNMLSHTLSTLLGRNSEWAALIDIPRAPGVDGLRLATETLRVLFGVIRARGLARDRVHAIFDASVRGLLSECRARARRLTETPHVSPNIIDGNDTTEQGSHALRSDMSLSMGIGSSGDIAASAAESGSGGEGLLRHSGINQFSGEAPAQDPDDPSAVPAFVSAAVLVARVFPEIAKPRIDDLYACAIGVREAGVLVADLVSLDPAAFVTRGHLSRWINGMVLRIADIASGDSSAGASREGPLVAHLLTKLAVSRPAVELLIPRGLLPAEEAVRMLLALRRLLYALPRLSGRHRLHTSLSSDLAAASGLRALIVDCIAMLGRGMPEDVFLPVFRRVVGAIVRTCALDSRMRAALRVLCSSVPRVAVLLEDYVLSSAAAHLSSCHVAIARGHADLCLDDACSLLTGFVFTCHVLADDCLGSLLLALLTSLRSPVHTALLRKAALCAASLLRREGAALAVCSQTSSRAFQILHLLLEIATDDDAETASAVLEALDAPGPASMLRQEGNVSLLVALAMSSHALAVRLAAVALASRVVSCEESPHSTVSQDKRICVTADDWNELSSRARGGPLAELEACARPMLERLLADVCVIGGVPLTHGTSIAAEATDAAIVLATAARSLLPVTFLAPYVGPLLHALLPHVSVLLGSGGGALPLHATGALLSVLGILVEVDPVPFVPHAATLLRTVARAWTDHNSARRRLAALAFASRLVRHVYRRDAFSPPIIADALADVLGVLRSEAVRPVRNEALRLLGLIGAVDPKRLQAHAEAESALHRDTARLNDADCDTDTRLELSSVGDFEPPSDDDSEQCSENEDDSGMRQSNDDFDWPLAVSVRPSAVDEDPLPEERFVRVAVTALLRIVDAVTATASTAAAPRATGVPARLAAPALRAIVTIVRNIGPRASFYASRVLPPVLRLAALPPAATPHMAAEVSGDRASAAVSDAASLADGGIAMLAYAPVPGISLADGPQGRAVFLLGVLAALVDAADSAVGPYAAQIADIVCDRLEEYFLQRADAPVAVAVLHVLRVLGTALAGAAEPALGKSCTTVLRYLRDAALRGDTDGTLASLETLRSLGPASCRAHVRALLSVLSSVATTFQTEAHADLVRASVLSLVRETVLGADVALELPLLASALRACDLGREQSAVASRSESPAPPPDSATLLAHVSVNICALVAARHPYGTSMMPAIGRSPIAPEDAAEVASALGSAVSQAVLHGTRRLLRYDELSLSALPPNLPGVRWDTAACESREDWAAWLRTLEADLLVHSPDAALAVCSRVAALHAPLAHALLRPAFAAFWSAEARLAASAQSRSNSPAPGRETPLRVASPEPLSVPQDDALVAIEDALDAAAAPPEVQHALLGVVEHMERIGQPLPLDPAALGAYAMRCHAYASALYYYEAAYAAACETLPRNTHASVDSDTESVYSDGGPTAEVVEALISVNSALGQPDAAVGVLVGAQRAHGLSLDAAWYERLHRWDDALAAYRARWDALGGLFGDLGDDSHVRTRTPGHSRRPSLGSGPGAPSLSAANFSPVFTANGTAVGDAPSPTALSASPTMEAMHPALLSETKEVPSGNVLVNEENRDVLFGVVRCWHALGNWAALDDVVARAWPALDGALRTALAPVAASAAWSVGAWDAMAVYAAHVPAESLDGSLFRAVLALRHGHADETERRVTATREALDDGELRPLLVGAEPYARAYTSVVRVQMLSELEEIASLERAKLVANSTIVQKGIGQIFDAQDQLFRTVANWAARLEDAHEVADVWQRVLKVRALIIPPREDAAHWLRLASLCRRAGRMAAARAILVELAGGPQAETAPLVGAETRSAPPAAAYGLLKHMWVEGERASAFKHMRAYVRVLARAVDTFRGASAAGNATSSVARVGSDPSLSISAPLINTPTPHCRETVLMACTWDDGEGLSRLLARCYHRLGLWQQALADSSDADARTQSTGADDESSFESMRAHRRRASAVRSVSAEECFLAATSYDRKWYRAWHAWALANQDLASRADGLSEEHSERSLARPLSGHSPSRSQYLIPAVQGFVRAIALADTRGGALQDALRLLTLWFRHGPADADVHAAVADGLPTVPLACWLHVVPQLIARIAAPAPQVRRLLHQLLADLGRAYPQALIFPLAVASKAQAATRRSAASALLDRMRAHAADLVEQALLVSDELVRVAVLWDEAWHEALEEASRLYYGEGDVDGMLAVLEPMHTQLTSTPENALTARERAFIEAHGRELREARELSLRYRRDGDAADLSAAWERYHAVLRRIAKALPATASIDLRLASPRLLAARDLRLAVPGTAVVSVDSDDNPSSTPPSIVAFGRTLRVISSKQRPRRVSVLGSDGRKHRFLLKGHEDLRQDERAVQLFGLVNTALAADPESRRRSLAIARFPIVPLSQSTGLIGWIPQCDTMHALVRAWRDARGVPLPAEHRAMLAFAPDYDRLPVVCRAEAFERALAGLSADHKSDGGRDLAYVMWRRAPSCEAWLAARVTYTRSAATASVAGYVLGLGDRHPSNVMLERGSGRVVHIDFGDCFEVAMRRERYPERVPFRLTRMMVRAMEAGGVEGSFRAAAEHTMRVLRSSRDSLMAVLEAFVHDPLINWRLFTDGASHRVPARATSSTHHSNASGFSTVRPRLAVPHGRDEHASGQFPVQFSSVVRARTGSEIERLEEESILRADSADAGALAIVARVAAKLSGRDYAPPVFQDDGRGILLSSRSPVDATALAQLLASLPPAGAVPAQSVATQIDRLIREATSVENLCQAYVGWCAFW